MLQRVNKYKKITHTFSGKLEDYKKLLRNYRLDRLLVLISEISSNLFIKGKNHPWEKIKNKVQYNKNFMEVECDILPWNLLYMSYYAILSTNDYRGKVIINKNEINFLIHANENFLQVSAQNSIPIEKKSRTTFFLYLFTIASEQFWMQDLQKVFLNFAREAYILFNCDEKESNKNLEILFEEFGLQWENVITILLIAWMGTMAFSPEINKLIEIIKWDDDITLEDFIKTIRKYTCSYKDVRECIYERQIFYTKPYIETERSGIIGVNCFSGFKIIEHSLYWVLMNHYRCKEDKPFSVVFGHLFENYVSELLQSYLSNDEYIKIEEDKKRKRADWLINIDGRKYLIEQKSSMIKLEAKQQLPNIDSIEEYSEKIIEAFEQLQETEDDFNDAEYIKIVLLYDDYFYQENKNMVFDLETCKIKNDGRFWLMTIDDLERLLELKNTDIVLYREIIKEKDYRERNFSKEGSTIRLLLNEKNINTKGCRLNKTIEQYYKLFEGAQTYYR